MDDLAADNAWHTRSRIRHGSFADVCNVMALLHIAGLDHGRARCIAETPSVLHFKKEHKFNYRR